MSSASKRRFSRVGSVGLGMVFFIRLGAFYQWHSGIDIIYYIKYRPQNERTNTMQEITLDSLMDGMDVDTTALLQNSQKSKTPLYFNVERELTEEDVELAENSNLAVPVSSLSRIKHSHHQAARFIAQGMSNIDVSRVTGYSPSHIKTLLRDPAFAEIVEHYKSKVDEEFDSVVSQMKSLTADALQTIQQRMDENPDEFTVAELRKIVESIGAQAGYSPITRNLNINANLSSAQIQQAKAKVKEVQKGNVKTITQEAQEAEYVLTESAEEPETGDIIEGTSRDVQEECKVERLPSKG